MLSKYGFNIIVILFLLSSCSHEEQFPDKISEKAGSENVVLNGSFYSENDVFSTDTVKSDVFEKEINELLKFKTAYEKREPEFSLKKMEDAWDSLKPEIKNPGFENIKKWIEISGFLLELTGYEKYPKEIEKIVYDSPIYFSGSECREIEKWITPWIFTKDIDHIYVNLFANASIKYEHSLKGAVEITQETNYPESGKILIRFKMQEKRYIELFIRIPDWAEGATVEEKGVKYVAVPGKYCQVLRKWSEGDLVEIYLPKEKMPDYLK